MGYAKQAGICIVTAGLTDRGLGAGEAVLSIRETVMSQQSVRQAARRALDAWAVRRKGAGRPGTPARRLADAVLTAIGEHVGAVGMKACRGGALDDDRP